VLHGVEAYGILSFGRLETGALERVPPIGFGLLVASQDLTFA
jgi:hypothetical protein